MDKGLEDSSASFFIVIPTIFTDLSRGALNKEAVVESLMRLV